MAYIIINTGRSRGTINRNIYGHFSEHLGRCIYEGLYVGENSAIPNEDGMRTDVLNALRRVRVPVLRWPGGCFADTYHWMDGIGPGPARKTIVNTNWGGVTEDNSFGTHEFLTLCEKLGCEPYISGNIGSGTVHEFSDWVEYCNMGGESPMAALRRQNGREDPWNVRYWGLGNEAWGCGGNMRPEYYADLCRQYSTFLRTYDRKHPLYKIASGANVDDYRWTEVVTREAGELVNAVSLHYYTVPGDWKHKGSATDFTRQEYYVTLAKALRMKELLDNHIRAIEQNEKMTEEKKEKTGLVVDEWGTWFDVEPGTEPGFLYQQNTMRDAIVAALTLNLFNDRCDRVVMANIAQVANVLQSLVLTEGPEMILTPTYHVFDMYKDHQDAKQLETYAETRLVGAADYTVPTLSVSASEQKNGNILLTAANLSDNESAPVRCLVAGRRGGAVEARVLTGAVDARNTFEVPDAVHPVPLAVTAAEDGFSAVLPPCSVAAFTIAAE